MSIKLHNRVPDDSSAWPAAKSYLKMKEAVVDLQNIIGPLKQNATPVAIIFPWSLSSAIIHHDFVVMLDENL